MGFLFWGNKKAGEEKQKELENAVGFIKGEFEKVTDWIKHLHSKNGKHEENFVLFNSRLTSLEKTTSEIKDLLSFFGPKLFKQQQTYPMDVYKHANIQGVRTNVQVPVQSDILRNLTTMERAIIWVLLNTELKLSYEDIAALLGKDRATIRGQVNAIKQKSEGLIEEMIEKTGKKRIYVPEPTKESLLKAMKTKQKEKRAKKENKFV